MIQHAVLYQSFQLHSSDYNTRSNPLNCCKLKYTFLRIISVFFEGIEIFSSYQHIT